MVGKIYPFHQMLFFQCMFELALQFYAYLLTILILRYVFHFARSPLGLISFIVIPGILIIVGEVWNITKIKKETSENNKDKKSNKSDKKKNKSTKKAKK